MLRMLRRARGAEWQCGGAGPGGSGGAWEVPRMRAVRQPLCGGGGGEDGGGGLLLSSGVFRVDSLIGSARETGRG